MIIRLDNRENDLHNEIKKIGLPEGVTMTVSALPLGDIILGDETQDFLIIERKCIADLLASIKDGRYEEQSYRLTGIDHPNHNIMYLIEGDVSSQQKAAVFRGGKFIGLGSTNTSSNTNTNTNTLYSAMFSLNYFKGFSVFRTLSLQETAAFILNTSRKLSKELKDGKRGYYTKQSTETVAASVDEKDYVNVVKKVKKENINKSNIGEIMLSQIPGISAVTATAIMQEFKTIQNLIQRCKEDPNLLSQVCTVAANGAKRKISKSCVSSILEYLVHEADEE